MIWSRNMCMYVIIDVIHIRRWGRSVTESNVGKSAVAFQKQTHKRVFWFRHVRPPQQEQDRECGRGVLSMQMSQTLSLSHSRSPSCHMISLFKLLNSPHAELEEN